MDFAKINSNINLSNEKKSNAEKTNILPMNSCSNKISTSMTDSRTPSPDISGQNFMISPKPNQVSNVILYGVPIVSLYIESQERLCLAQISNTLLKQFSYNEIHNRRVALGITCVQCTPVQLEILRRAGAMPVSSRRCGMITRREAERLCKSFLGDNSPPRLPDDFSFAVFHECAWGCRGAFVPSRYNSSRAKCIKCTYCGLFFSPNKFIFHSHRLSQNDKYVQPDAANFNSWRRHLKLSGSPLESVTHAWEDVKAMFNGGTRKRLLSSPISKDPKNLKLESSRKFTPFSTQHPSNQLISTKQTNCPPAVSNTNNNNNQITAPGSHASPNITVSLNTNSSSSSFSQELPFSLSRSIMIDYMWHHQQNQVQSTSINTSTATNKGNNFQFGPYSALNWIKQPPSFLFKPNNTAIVPMSSSLNDEKSSSFNHFHSAAFKPVINMRLTNSETNIVSSSLMAIGDSNGCINNGIHLKCQEKNNHSPSSSTSSNYNQTTASSANQSDDEQSIPLKKLIQRRSFIQNKEPISYVNETIDAERNRLLISYDNREHNEYGIYANRTSDDESEMVDIESTEDDVQILNLQNSQYIAENDEEIEVVEERTIDNLENNNNNINFISSGNNYQGAAKQKNSIKTVKEIVKKNECENEEKYSIKRNAIKPADFTLNLKKEPIKQSSPSTSFNNVQKIHATSKTCLDGSTQSSTSTKLWSVARLSLECNNNNNSDNDLRKICYPSQSNTQQKNVYQLDATSNVYSSTV